MVRGLERQKGRRDYVTSFAGIPRMVMLSESFLDIGSSSTLVLLWLAFQYKGNNNGYLSATRNQAKAWGIGGADTLSRAIRELQAHRLITLTQHGRFQNPSGSPNLYAITWEPIHEKQNHPLEVAATRLPLRKDWRPRTENTSPCPVLESVAPVSGHGDA